MIVEKGHGMHKHKETTGLFKGFIVCLFLTFALTILGKFIDDAISDERDISLRNENKSDLKESYNDYKKDLNDNYISMNKAMNDYHLEYVRQTDSNTGLLVYKVKSLEKRLENNEFGGKDEIALQIPDEYYQKPNPFFTLDKLNNDLRFNLAVINSGKSVAKFISTKYDIVAYKNGRCYLLQENPTILSEKDVFIAKDDGERYIYKHFDYIPSNDNIYIAFKLDYSNIKGDIKGTVRKFYLFSKINENKAVPQAIYNETIELEQFMINNKIWKEREKL